MTKLMKNEIFLTSKSSSSINLEKDSLVKGSWSIFEKIEDDTTKKL